MDSQAMLWIVFVVLLFGLLALWAIYRFGSSIFGRFLPHTCSEYYGANGHSFPARLIVDLVTDFRERRNEFWLAYGQVVIALVIVTLLTVLLLTRTISAEAGLPILSAISGFAIAKGSTATRSRSTDQPPEENDQTRRG